MKNNYLNELFSLLDKIGFKDISGGEEYIFSYKKIIVLEDMNHQSDLEWILSFYDNDETPTKENTEIKLKISLYNSRESFNIHIKKLIEYLKHEFKYVLRNKKINKLLHDS